MSQENLADLLGITFQQIQKYEKGSNRIAASRLWDIAEALNVPIAYFFEGASNRKSGPSPSEAVLATPDGAKLAALFATLKDRKVRRRVVELVEALARE